MSFKEVIKNETSMTKVAQNEEQCLGERKHVCLGCMRVFTQKIQLMSHLSIYCDKKPWVCPTCFTRFKHKTHLREHMYIHSGKKPYQCPTCCKQFNSKYNLDVHIGTKTYECKTCYKQFSRKCGLNEHIRIHIGVKPFSCSICKKKITTRSNLHTHFRRHLNKQGKNSSKPKEVFREFDELLKRFGCLKNSKIVCHKLTDDEIQQYSSRGYLENLKKEIDDGLKQNESGSCFKFPFIKEESNLEDELADKPIRPTSYQNLFVKQEPIENADPTCDNQFDGSFIKEETQIFNKLIIAKSQKSRRETL